MIHNMNMDNALVFQSLREVKDFMLPAGFPDKDRQKLMRNLRVNIINTPEIMVIIIIHFCLLILDNY